MSPIKQGTGLTRRPRGRAWTGLSRGACGRCPDCGRGRRFRAYFKVQRCRACGHDNGQYPADDAAPYFMILVVGHLMVAPLLAFRFIWTWPTGVLLAVLLPALAALTLTVLPIVKGAVVGTLWAVGRPPSA